MDFINEHIVIGDSSDAKDYDSIRASGIGAVLNVAFDLDIAPCKDIEHAKVGLIDGPGNEASTLVSAVYMLRQLLKRHDKVLVHCHAGHSRAPTVVCAYLAHWKYRDLGFFCVLEVITKKRPLVKPNSELCDLATRILLRE